MLAFDIRVEESTRYLEVRIGQLDKNHLLSGIGRKIKIYSVGGGYIWEGQFTNN
jgi:hypothetical protein